MNGLFFLLGIHGCLWFSCKQYRVRMMLCPELERLLRAFRTRDYSFRSVQEPKTLLERRLRTLVEHQLRRGEWDEGLGLELFALWGELEEAMNAFISLRHQALFHLAFAAASCLGVRLLMPGYALGWLTWDLSSLITWISYALLLRMVWTLSPRPWLAEGERTATLFLESWLGSSQEGPWRSLLEEALTKAWRDGVSVSQQRIKVLKSFWEDERRRFEKQKLLWEELMPLGELLVFLGLAAGLWLEPLAELGLLGIIRM